MNLRAEPGILGTNAHLLADITLLAYILLLLPLMAVGFFYARRKMFEPQHKYVMTSITLLNWVLILWVMAVSFTESVSPQLPDGLNQTFVLFPAIHALTGATAQIIATYLLARMWLEDQLPAWAKIRNIKIYMRVTLSLWVITAVLGITTYIIWYGGAPASTGDVPEPVATDEVGVPTEEIAEPVTTDEPDEPVATSEATEDNSEMVETEAPDEPVSTPEVVETAEIAVEEVMTEEPAEPVTTDEPGEPAMTPEAAETEEVEEEVETEEPEACVTEEPDEPEDPVTTPEAGETEEPDSSADPCEIETEEPDEPVTTPEVEESEEEEPEDPVTTPEADDS